MSITTQDPTGRSWLIRRVWWPFRIGMDWNGMRGVSDDPVGYFFYALMLINLVLVVPLALVWPFWVLARLLGAPWTVVVECDGKVMGRERIAGWDASTGRMRQIAAQVSGRQMAFAAMR